MEQAILAMLGIIITLMLYLDRGRRADDALIRRDMNENDAQIRREMRDGNAQIRQEMNDGFERVHNRLDKLTDVVMDLCRRVGRLEGRAEVFEPRPDTSQ